MFEADPTPAEQIERLEAEIDELREAIQRSRRLVVAGRACAFAGAALFLGLLLGLATFTPVRMIVGITVALGGLVLMGSSVGSTKQLERSLKQTEDERNAAIDALEFVEFGAGPADFASVPSVWRALRRFHGLLHNDIERGQVAEDDGEKVDRQRRDVDRGAVGGCGAVVEAC